MTNRVKRESVPRRLFLLSSAILLACVHGSNNETLPSSNYLRRERYGNTRAVNDLDEIIHHAGTIRLQELAEAIAESNNTNESTNNISSFTTTTTATTATARTSANTNKKMRLDPSNSAPTPARSIIRQSFRYYTNTNENTFVDRPGIIGDESPKTDDANGVNPTRTKDESINPVSRTDSETRISSSQGITFVDSNNDEVTSAVLTYQETVGFCGGPGPGVGCANEEPNADNPKGNPNDVVNCYDITSFGVEIPFGLESIKFWIGDSTALTPDLQLNVWVGMPGGGPISSRLLYSQPLFGYNVGENTFDIDYGGLVRQSNICVGITSVSVNAGLRIQTDPGGAGEASYVRSPACLIDEFISLSNAGLKNDFCIEVLVSFADGLRRRK